MFSHNTQLDLSGYGDIDVGLPPASPSAKESAKQASDRAPFPVDLTHSSQQAQSVLQTHRGLTA